MASNAVGAAGGADPQVVALIQGVNDERVVVASAKTRFAVAGAKSDALADDDNSARAKRAREAARDEDARYKLRASNSKNARDTLAKYGAAMIAGPSTSSSLLPLDAADEVDLEEKASFRSVKRKLVTPKPWVVGCTR
jgi:hypothetical protein